MFRFSIRDLVWLTTVVGLSCGLIANWALLAKRQKQLEEQTKRALQLEGLLGQAQMVNEHIRNQFEQLTKSKAIHDALQSIRPVKDQPQSPQNPHSN